MGSDTGRVRLRVHQPSVVGDGCARYGPNCSRVPHHKLCGRCNDYFCLRACVWYAIATTVLILTYLWNALAVGPLFLGPLSEIYGRVIVLQISNLWYLGAAHFIISLLH